MSTHFAFCSRKFREARHVSNGWALVLLVEVAHYEQTALIQCHSELCLNDDRCSQVVATVAILPVRIDYRARLLMSAAAGHVLRILVAKRSTEPILSTFDYVISRGS